jgi:putative ABC transport system ATP-binding protein
VAVIELKNLEKAYVTGDVETKVLRGISFSVEQGEFVAIMGPSGSGKSTMLHILGFLDRPTGGAYLFKGKTIAEYSDEDLAYIRNESLGFVFQQFNLLRRTSVFENVQLPLLYSDVPEKEWETRTMKAIEAVGLGHRVQHESEKLSGGEKQRVAIARALVNDPDIIFADEPTGNLDSKSGKAVMEIIQKLNAEGKTIILITHETYTARYAERIIHLHDGEIELDEKVETRSDINKFEK